MTARWESAPVVSLETATGAHAMQTDPTNSYAFVPHIAGNGPNQIWQFRFERGHGPNYPQLSGHSGAGRIPGAPSLLLSSLAGRPLLLQRAGVQCERLPLWTPGRERCRYSRPSPPFPRKALLRGTPAPRSRSPLQESFCTHRTGAMTASPVIRWTPPRESWRPTASLRPKPDPTRYALGPQGTGTSIRPARIQARWRSSG